MSGAIVTVSVDWDTRITVTNASLGEAEAMVDDVREMLGDCYRRALDAVMSGHDEEERR